MWCKKLDFKKVEDYYQSISMKNRVSKIEIDTLFFNVTGDVIIGANVLEESISKNPHTHMIEGNAGNHLGTITKDGSDIVSRVTANWFEEE